MSATDAPALIHSTGLTAGPVSVYYERFEPVTATGKLPVVMVHGGAHSGGCYQRTANGRPGWAYDFVAHGYPVIVPDWPGIGRSGHIPFDQLTGTVVVEGLGRMLQSLGQPVILLVHSMAGAYGWRLAERHPDIVKAVLGITPSPPGNIQPVTPVVGETADTIEIETFGRRLTINKTALNFPSAETVSSKYVGNSRFFPHERLEDYRASLLGLPPRIMAQRRNIAGSQVRLDDPTQFAGLPALIVTGTADLDHPREVDERIATWLNEQGAQAEFCFLGDHGIVGNGHMLMVEDNSSEIAEILVNWLENQAF